MSALKTRMLRWMCVKIRIDRIRKEHFRECLMVASVGHKVREIHLRWFGHVQRRLAMVPVKKNCSMQVDGSPRRRCRLKRAWLGVTIDLKKCYLLEDLARDRPEWRNKIHVANPT